VVHRIAPGREIRRFGLQPFDPDVYPAVAQVIDDALAQAGLRRRPTILVETSMKHPWGRAFGSFGRYYIKITRGVAAARTDDELAVARAIVRHELAHVANRDLPRSDRAESGQCPRVRDGGRAARSDDHRVPGARLGAGRDVAARRGRSGDPAGAGGAAEVPRARRGRARLTVGGRRRRRAVPHKAFADPPRRWWSPRGLLNSHPPRTWRETVTESPRELLCAGTAEAFSAGVVAGVVFGYLIGASREATSDDLLGLVSLAVPVGGLVVGVVGTGLWRATLRALAEGSRLPSGVPVGIALTAGFLAADVIGPPGEARLIPALQLDPVPVGIALVAITGLFVAFCRCTVGIAAAWIPTARSSRLLPVLAGGHVVGAFALGSVLCLAYLGLSTLRSGNPFALV
jgi:hypothetical protein